MNQKFLKPLIIFGGGLLLFLLLKPKDKSQNTTGALKSFDDTDNSMDVLDKEKDAQIVMKAYLSAVENGESSARLEELNKECMKEFGLECRMSKSGKAIIYDKKGKKILSS
jgi:hypothetical protein